MSVSSADTAELPLAVVAAAGTPMLTVPDLAPAFEPASVSATPAVSSPPPDEDPVVEATTAFDHTAVTSPSAPTAPGVPARATVVAERRRLRRRQRVLATCGLAVVAGVFGATVVVLDVLH